MPEGIYSGTRAKFRVIPTQTRSVCSFGWEFTAWKS